MKISVPGSTSNLGSGFDCFGLALKLYLTVEATITPDSSEPYRVTTTGAKENEVLPRNAANLICRAMAFAARRENLSLPPLELKVHNEIPLACGLGSSAAAIVAGIKLCTLVSGHEITDQAMLNYTTEFEGHPDNVSASLCGGFVINCTREDRSVIAAKFDWPGDIRVVVVSPHSQLPTHVARAALSRTVSRAAAVHNLQRTALFTAALAQQRHELFWDAMHDQLHQPQREALVPGLAEALALPRMAGLLGLALSGAGPSIVALATDHTDEIADRIAGCFRARNIRSTTRTLEVDNDGCRLLQ